MDSDGVFVDRRTHWLGRIGPFGMSFAKHAGGALGFGRPRDEPQRGTLSGTGLTGNSLRVSARLRLVCRCDSDAGDYDQPVLIRQENDPAPKIMFLEEGPVRVGMRVLFDLLDENGHYHGDGRMDAWLYAE